MNASSSSSDRDPLERLAAEFLERRRRGERPALSEYTERYPQWAEQIREFFPALEVMEGLKPGSGDQTSLLADQPDGAGAPLLERLGEYRILREIGRGGMGVVYEAIQESLGRRVALKILPLHGRIDPVQMERFQLESRSAARLHHTSIVPVYGVGEHQGVHYYVMQYIQGHGLEVILDDLRRLRAGAAAMPPSASREAKDDTGSVAIPRSLLTGRFASAASSRDGREQAAEVTDKNSAVPAPLPTPVPRSQSDGSAISSVLSQPTEPGYYHAVARLGVQVAEALAHAHGQGVLHRDIKPSNLLLDVDGHVWITDFGLAKLEGSDGPTHTGDIVGTLRYMAPERFEGWSDPRSDIYGLGMTLYELLTLHPAFESATRAKLIDQVIHDPPAAPRKHDPRIPRDLETIVLKAIAKEPAERYATAEAMGADLANFLADRPIVARRSSLLERSWRWCRRSPAAAGFVMATGVAALALVGVAVGLVDNARVKASRREAVTARQDEARQRQKAEAAQGAEQRERKKAEAAAERERRLGYFHNMVLAEREWSDSNVGRAEPLLDLCVPQPVSNDLRDWEWHYLKRQCHTDLNAIAGPQGQAMGLAFSPDDRYLASTGYEEDKAVRVWNVQTGELEQTLLGLTGGMSEGVAFSPDGKLLAASSGDYFEPGGVIIWDAATWKKRRHFPGVCGESSNVAFSPDGKRLAAVSGEWNKRPKLTIWDVTSETEPRTILGAKGGMGWISVAFSPDGNSIATASGKLDQLSPDNQPGEVKIWNSWTGKLIGTLPHPSPLTCVAWSRARSRPVIATTGWDMMLRLWDVREEREIKSIRAAPQVSFKVAFNPDGSRLATVGDDNAARIWDAATLEIILTLRGHTREVHSLAFSSDGRRLATQSMGSTVKIWDAVQEKQHLSLPGHPGSWVQAVSFSPDGRHIASGGIDAILRVHDAASGQKWREFNTLTEPIECMAYSPDGKMIATGSGNWQKRQTLGRVTVRNAANGALVFTREAHAGLVMSIAFSPDGSRLATGGGEHDYVSGVVKIWDTKTGKQTRNFAGHNHNRVKVAFSPDGGFLASASWDKLVIIRDANTGELLRPPMEGHEAFITGLAYSPNGERLATVGLDGAVIVWDTATGEQVCRFLGHKTIVWSVAFSPNGKRAASCGDDGTVKIWDPVTGQEALTLRGHTAPVLCVAFSPDGNHIASASKDGTVKIWDGSPYIESATTRSQALHTNANR